MQMIKPNKNQNQRLVQKTAVSLLINLETAQRGRSVLLLDEQKLLVNEKKKGFAKNTKLDFYEH
jgi:hypothetical protein